MKSSATRRTIKRVFVALVFLFSLLLACEVFARVGGGDMFGGGGSGGGGGGDGDAGLLFYLIWLAIEHPTLGVPLLVIFGCYWFFRRHLEKKNRLPASAEANFRRNVHGALARTRLRVKSQMASVTQDDPNFSEILFLDFAQMIQVRLLEARGAEGNLEALRPFLDEGSFRELEALHKQSKQGGRKIDSVIIGAIHLSNVLDMGSAWSLSCSVELNYSEHESGKQQDWFARWQLNFERAKGVLSKGPEAIRTLGCPSCGSPLKLDVKGVCAYCDQAVSPGLFHWKLRGAEELLREWRIDRALSLSGHELGSNFPTLFDPELDVSVRDFMMRYPGESLGRLKERAQEIFVRLQAAWTSGNWEQARAVESDRVYQVHLFWMDRYRSQGMRNVLEQVEVQDATLVKLDRDAFYEMATLRIRASMIDYTLRVDELVSGSKSQARVFSEYWTLMRRKGFEPGSDKAASQCPSCGAPIKVTMNGRCAHCDAHLSSGQFDWTLAKIEQDEAYAG